MNEFSAAKGTRCGELQENGTTEKGGVLTSEMVSSCLSQPGCFCIKLHHIYHLSLPSDDLSDISVFCSYIQLQKLELPHNKIKDLSSLSHMPNLVVLDVSHNEVCDYFEFQPLQYLQEVNFSHNHMTKMKDLSAYVSLRKLYLDHNSFCEISGLEWCCRLTHLSLAHNKITRISGLDSLPLTYLCLKGNHIERTEGLETLKSLQVLDLSLNRTTNLSGLQNLHLLGSINLEKNQISEIQEFKYIQNLLLLRDLNLQENPVQEEPDYRLSLIFCLQHLAVLDRVTVSAEEKVTSVNKYDPPLDLVAARDHMTQLVYQLMQPQVLYDSTLATKGSPYPLFVLTGPEGCGKRELVHRLCQEFSEYLGYGIGHTTREPYFGEENGIDYHFVSNEDFQNMIYMGKFIQTVRFGDHQFGLTRDAIETVAKEGLACCVHVELEGVFSLKKSFFEPRYILLLPTQLEKYINRLKSLEVYTPAQIDVEVSRVELYANTNSQLPRFFDYVIPCDDLEEAYQTLQQMVKDYLSLEEEEKEEEKSRGASPVCTFTAGMSTSSRSGTGSGTCTSLSASPSDPSDSIYRPYAIQAELNSQITPVELASIRKREQLVREAIAGRRPGVLSQLFKSVSPTSSLQNKVPSTHFPEDDSSSDESCASSALSVPGSDGNLKKPLNTSVLVRRMDALEDNMPSDIISNTPHPTTDEFPGVGSPSSDGRPGSKAKIILPPISTGQKTPAVSSPTQSPILSPDLAGEEAGTANMEE